MSNPVQPSHPETGQTLARAARLLHRCVLGLLAACALTIALGSDSDSAGDVPPRSYTLAGVGLALGVVAARRLATSPVIGARVRARLSIVALVLAGAIGLVAASLGAQHGATQSALVFTLAAAVFVLRPPALEPAASPNSGA
jgi:FtsH-binding integral membrane protein